MSPSPELDLLETLASQDEKLIVVLSIFSASEDDNNFERAKRVPQIYADSGVIEIYRIVEVQKQGVPDWQIRFVLSDKTNWLNSTQKPIYWLSLTDKGHEIFLEDSYSFFDELFRK